jgi:mRNA export factor
MRQPNPTAVIPLSERVYAMDAKTSAVVVATADRMLHIYDMNSGQSVASYKSPLSYQTRCVSVFSDR